MGLGLFGIFSFSAALPSPACPAARSHSCQEKSHLPRSLTWGGREQPAQAAGQGQGAQPPSGSPGHSSLLQRSAALQTPRGEGLAQGARPHPSTAVAQEGPEPPQPLLGTALPRAGGSFLPQLCLPPSWPGRDLVAMSPGARMPIRGDRKSVV